jgi:hypothetical protein
VCFGEKQDEITDEELEAWPNCSVPDCAYKVCTWLGGDRCYAHSLGLTPQDPGEYFQVGSDDD